MGIMVALDLVNTGNTTCWNTLSQTVAGNDYIQFVL
jgi:hypothetical protein